MQVFAVEEDGVVGGDAVQVVAGGIVGGRPQVVVPPAAQYPTAGAKLFGFCGHLRQHVFFGGNAVEVNASEAARIFEKVDVGIDQAGDDGAATEVDAARLAGHEAHVLFAAHHDYAPILNGEGARVGHLAVHSVDARILDNQRLGHGCSWLRVCGVGF